MMTYEEFSSAAVTLLGTRKEMSSADLRLAIGRSLRTASSTWHLLNLFQRTIEEKCGRRPALQPVVFYHHMDQMIKDGLVNEKTVKVRFPSKKPKHQRYYSLRTDDTSLTCMSAVASRHPSARSLACLVG